MSDTTDSTEQMQSTPDAGGRGQLVNDGGDATLLLHEGVGLEMTLGNDGILRDPENSMNPVIKRVMKWAKAFISLFANQWTQISDHKKKTMSNAIDGKIGHIGNEVEMEGLDGLEETRVGKIMPQAIDWLKKRGLMTGLTFSDGLTSRQEDLRAELAACLMYGALLHQLPDDVIHDNIRDEVERCLVDLNEFRYILDTFGNIIDVGTEHFRCPEI